MSGAHTHTPTRAALPDSCSSCSLAGTQHHMVWRSLCAYICINHHLTFSPHSDSLKTQTHTQQEQQKREEVWGEADVRIDFFFFFNSSHTEISGNFMWAESTISWPFWKIPCHLIYESLSNENKVTFRNSISSRMSRLMFPNFYCLIYPSQPHQIILDSWKITFTNRYKTKPISVT